MDVKLPKLGEGADSGVVVSLLVKEGDQVKEGQTILELENEKAIAPIPANGSGTVTKLRVKEGDKISVGQVILSLDTGAAEAKPTKERESAGEAPKAISAGPVQVEDEHEEETDVAAEMPSKSDVETASHFQFETGRGGAGDGVQRVLPYRPGGGHGRGFAGAGDPRRGQERPAATRQRGRGPGRPGA